MIKSLWSVPRGIIQHFNSNEYISSCSLTGRCDAEMTVDSQVTFRNYVIYDSNHNKVTEISSPTPHNETYVCSGGQYSQGYLQYAFEYESDSCCSSSTVTGLSGDPQYAGRVENGDTEISIYYWQTDGAYHMSQTEPGYHKS